MVQEMLSAGIAGATFNAGKAGAKNF